jgi:hypothetical protein
VSDTGFRPSTVIISQASRLSTVAPNRRIRCPIPPQRVSPAIPVVLTVPDGTIRPCSCVAASSSEYDTGLRPHGESLRIDGDFAPAGEIQYEGPARHGIAVGAVAAAAHRDRQIAR